MIKLVGLYKRKPGMSREAFIAYYENTHAPLVMKLLPQVREYRRTYSPSEFLRNSVGEPLWFDVIQETWFATREIYDEMLAMLLDPEIGRLIEEDEVKFMDKSAQQLFIADERRSA